MLVSEFMRSFHRKLYEVAPEEVQRDIIKQERAVKHTLYTVMGGKERLTYRDAAHYQERFHVRIDQLASDYRTWKRGGCKAYARPKQYVSGRVAGASKKAFDFVLGTYLLAIKEQFREMEGAEKETVLSERSISDSMLRERSSDQEDPLADFNPS